MTVSPCHHDCQGAPRLPGNVLHPQFEQRGLLQAFGPFSATVFRVHLVEKIIGDAGGSRRHFYCNASFVRIHALFPVVAPMKLQTPRINPRG